jgi:endoglucanase
MSRAALVSLVALVAAATATSASAAGWTTSGPRIVSSGGSEFRITGINWYGFETRDGVAHGLYAQDFHAVVDQVKQYGYNTIRIPWSNAMWEADAVVGNSKVSACPTCKGKTARDVLAMIVNYAGSIGLHVMLDNHRSTAGNSAESNGLWYTSGFSEQQWRNDWVQAQQWAHGTLLGADTVRVSYLASDGLPVVVGYDLRNEPHSPSTRTDPAYTKGATWGSGDGISPASNPNPNPYAPSCVAASTCHDWRLAAERAGDDLMADAGAHAWDPPLIVVEGIGLYPSSTGTVASGPYDGTWWGGNLLGVDGNAGNPGAPVVLNAGGNATSLGTAINNQVVYSPHDYGPNEYVQSWFNASTCYVSGCSASSLADIWKRYWAHLNLAGGVNPVWPGHAAYPWANTGAAAYSQAPLYLGELGTGKTDAELYSTTRGSQGQWFTDMVNLIQSSYARTAANDPGYGLTSLSFTYWALNTEDAYGLLSTGYTGLANQRKEYTFHCAVQQGPLAIPAGTGAGQCGSTGALPAGL